MAEEEVIKQQKNSNLTLKLRNNPWILSTFVVGILAVVLLAGSFGNFSFTGNVISADEAGNLLLGLYESGGLTGLSVDSVEEISGIYQVNISYQGQVVPFYVTKDGKYIGQMTLVSSDSPDSSSDSSPTIPKSDKPVVELYVFTYCPYGTQAEKGIIPVVKLLGNKIDFRIRQIGAMHGEFEKIEAERQLCIEKNYPDKYLDYLSAFISDSKIGDCNGDSACLTPLLNSIYSKLGIDASKINSCMKTDGEAMYDDEVSNAQSKGIRGSPTLVINGVAIPMSSDNKFYAFNDQKIPFSRSADTYKKIICSLFNTKPEECSKVLSTDSPSAGFGASSGSSSAAQC
jgi:hypothetical protein